MKSLFLNRFEKVSDGRSVDVLVVYVALEGQEDSAIGSPIEREIEDRLSPDELIIIAREAEAHRLANVIERSRALNSMRQRLGPRSSLTILGFDSKGSESTRIPLHIGDVSSGVKLSEILRRGVTSIFRERGGFVESTASYHFLNPSGRHTSRFIRLSNLLVLQSEISFIALSLLPAIPDDAHIVYVDTPSLFAVVAAINDHRRLSDANAQNLVVDNFRSYEGVNSYEFADLEKAIAIISASSSGGLAKKVEARGIDSSRIVHALYLGKVDKTIRFAVDLGSDEHENPDGLVLDRATFDADDCALCKQNSAPIPLRGDQFDIAPPQPKALKLKISHAPRGLAQTMNRLVGGNVFQILIDDIRQFQINTSALLGLAAFDKHLEYFVHRHVPPIRHCLYADDASLLLAKRVAKIAGVNPNFRRRDDIEGLESDLSSEQGGGVLVVGAAIGSGRVLLDISRDLRPICADRPIIYLVGFARTDSEDSIGALRRDLEMTKCPVPHPLATVERLSLPGGEFANSWIREFTFFNLMGQAGLSDDLCRRRDRLANSSSPLQNDLFVANSTGEELSLRPGFAFWPERLAVGPHSQADVFFTIAAILQNLRTRQAGDDDALVTNWFQQTLLSPANFGRFNDGIIQASLLRAARPTELDYAGDPALSRDAKRIIRRIVAEPKRARGEASAEFLIAIGCGRLRLAEADLKEVLEPISNSTDRVEELRLLARAALLDS